MTRHLNKARLEGSVFVDEDGDDYYYGFAQDSKCFFIIFKALMSKKDVSIIKRVLPYFIIDEEWSMEDIFTEMMRGEIEQIPEYITLILKIYS